MGTENNKNGRSKILIWLPLISFAIVMLGGFITWRVSLATAQVSAEHTLQSHTECIEDNAEGIEVLKDDVKELEKTDVKHDTQITDIKEQLGRVEDNTQDILEELRK